MLSLQCFVTTGANPSEGASCSLTRAWSLQGLLLWEFLRRDSLHRAHGVLVLHARESNFFKGHWWHVGKEKIGASIRKNSCRKPFPPSSCGFNAAHNAEEKQGERTSSTAWTDVIETRSCFVIPGGGILIVEPAASYLYSISEWVRPIHFTG